MTKTIYNQSYKELVSRLRTEREKNGLTQQGLAVVIKRPQSFVSKYENCERRLDVLEFITICRCLGLRASTLLTLFDQE